MVFATDIEAHAHRLALETLMRGSSDRAVVEQGVRNTYVAASLPPPEEIIWCDGPLDMVRRLTSLPDTAVPGASVKSELFEQAVAATSMLAEMFWKELFCSAVEASARERNLAEAVDRAVAAAADARLSRLSVRARHLWRRLRGHAPALPRGSFKDLTIGPVEHTQLAPYQRIHAVAGHELETRRLEGLCQLAANTGWIAPFERMCFVSERPRSLHGDANGRLHCANGPALAYPDGFCFWAWKGVEVPAWAITHPERITLSTLDDTVDPVVRRCLIEIMTPERLVASGAAKRLSRDETGILWGITWQYRGTTIDSWHAVEVVDGTPSATGRKRRHVLPVPTHLRTAREAVAWTYGLTAEQYSRLQLRT